MNIIDTIDTINIAITGNFNRDSIKANKLSVHKVLRPEYKLYIFCYCLTNITFIVYLIYNHINITHYIYNTSIKLYY